MKHRIGLLVVAGVVIGSVFAGIAAARMHPAKANVVTVTMVDFHFKFSPTGPLKHGVRYTFKIVNKGNALHNFDIQGVKASKVIPKGKTTLMVVTFTKAKKYPYLCDVPRHAELGMAGMLTVK